MKQLALVFILTLSASVAVAAQSRRPAKKPIVKKPVVAKTDGFVRERFDPARNPAVDLAAAMTKAKAEGKRIILDVGGEWCGWCVYMDKFFYQWPEVDRIRQEYFVWVKVNMSPENENRSFLSAYPQIEAYPHLFVLEADGKLLHSQATSELENGERYEVDSFTAFLETWTIKK